jgi:hypothetical protein
MSLRCSTEVGDNVFLLARLSVNIVLRSVGVDRKLKARGSV